MSETLTNGVIVPDKGSRDWYADLRSNWLKLDSLMAGGNITINPAQTEGILVATITVGGKEYKLYQQDGDVSVKIDPSAENAEYPLVASTSAEANTGSVVMAPAVTVNPSTGAVTAPSFKGAFEGGEVRTNTIRAVGGGANISLTSSPDNGGFAIRAFNGTTNKELVGYPNGMLAWGNSGIVTEKNQIMLAKNLSGTNIASGGIVDCGTGKAKLQGWYINDLGALALSGTLVVGKWKNVSIYPVGDKYSGMFLKVG